MKKPRLVFPSTNTSSRNKPRVIANEIREAIFAGLLKPGDVLPSVREAAEDWKQTKDSVQRAYKLLREEGVLVDSDDRGTLPGYMVDPETKLPDEKERMVRLERFLTQAMAAALATGRKRGYSALELEATAVQVLAKIQRPRKRAAKKKEDSAE